MSSVPAGGFGPRAIVFTGILQNAQVTPSRDRHARFYIPRAIVLQRVSQTIEMPVQCRVGTRTYTRPTGGRRRTREGVPLATVLVKELQTVQPSVVRSHLARFRVPRTTVLVKIPQDVQVPGRRRRVLAHELVQWLPLFVQVFRRQPFRIFFWSREIRVPARTSGTPGVRRTRIFIIFDSNFDNR